MKMKRFVPILPPVLAIILELLPCGAVLVFAAPTPDERLRQTFSYFSLTPVGYANFAPFITACLTCALLVLAIVAAARPGGRAKGALFVVSLVAAAVSLCPLLLGAEYFSITGGAITAVLVAECVLAKIAARTPERKEK